MLGFLRKQTAATRSGTASARGMLVAILVSITLMGTTIGLTLPLFSIAFDRMGFDASVVGLGASIQVGAVLVMVPLVPWLVWRLGAIPVMVWGIILAATGIVAAAHLHSVSLWLITRFVVGAGTAVHWVVCETWLNQIATDVNRGLVAGFYSALMAIGFATGPAILGVTGSEGLLPYLIGAGLMLAAVVPLLCVRGETPTLAHEQGQRFAGVLATAPVVILAALVSGFVDNATLALLPVYGLRLGMTETAAVLQITVATVGAVLLQIPLGWLGDRIGRRRVLVGCAAIKTAAVALLPVVVDQPALLWTVLFVWGGVAVAFYTLALALLGETFRGTSLAKATSVLVITYCLGSVIGPLGIGGMMDWMGEGGFVVGMVAVSALLAVTGLLRMHAQRF